MGEEGVQEEKKCRPWIRFLKIYRQHNVKLVWVKGHAKNPGNERCDQLAVEAYKRGDLLEDTGYDPITENRIDM